MSKVFNEHMFNEFVETLNTKFIMSVITRIGFEDMSSPPRSIKEGIAKLKAERDEARAEARKWRDMVLYQRTVPCLIAPLPWEANK